MTNVQVDLDGNILHDVIDILIGAPIEMDHDHNDANLHTQSFNIDFVAWSSLGVTLGENGFANFVLHEAGDKTLAFVAIDGDDDGGFNIADITDPLNIKPLGSYRAPGSGFQEVRVTPDGRHAVLNVQQRPGAEAPDGLGACSVCIHVVNVEDPTQPMLDSVLPVEVQGTHNMDIVVYGSDVYLFYVGQPLNNAPPGNRLGVARFVEDAVGMRLVPVGSFAHPALLDTGRSFPHDVLVQAHPDGRRIAYVSHWDGGIATFDATNPLAVTPLGNNKEQTPSAALAIHWTMQEPVARADGRTIAWSAPEIGSLDSGSGVIRSYDATDPAALRQLATWEVPGNISIEDRFIMSPHTTIPDMERGLLAVAHYHAGVWVLDIADPENPRALGYYIPHGDPSAPYNESIWWKKPNFSPDGFLPNAYMARWHDGLLWVTERGTGLYALEYTGPIPGKIGA